jgi:hypothetical protein
MHGLSAITQAKEHPDHDPQPFNAPGRGQMGVVNLAAATLQITILFFNPGALAIVLDHPRPFLCGTGQIPRLAPDFAQVSQANSGQHLLLNTQAGFLNKHFL